MRKDDALDYFKGRINLAKALGITPTAIDKWGTHVPNCRRENLRLAMKEKAEQLKKEERRIRAALGRMADEKESEE